MSNAPYPKIFSKSAAAAIHAAEISVSVPDPDQQACPVVILGPHNGWHIPNELHDLSDSPLGLRRDFFDPLSSDFRHETCDIGVSALFNRVRSALNHAGIHCYYLSSNVSRLVADLNRRPSKAITPEMVELGLTIPANDNLAPDQAANRIARYYTPYMDALAALTRQSKRETGGAILIDLHSFTPIWNGAQRPYHMGSMKCEISALSEMAENAAALVCEEYNLTFLPDHPYDVTRAPHKTNFVAELLCARLGVYYQAFECRNDILQDVQGLDAMANILSETIASIGLIARNNMVEDIHIRQAPYVPEYSLDMTAE